MIWICTISLLIVAAWLFFNAVNERRWVRAHSHDESVASDEGLFASFSAMTGSGSSSPDSKVSISQENSTFARSVSKISEKTSRLGERFFESRVAAVKNADAEQRPRSAREEDTFFGRAVALVSEKTDRVEQKLDLKVQDARSQVDYSTAPKEDLITRTARNVASKAADARRRLAGGEKVAADADHGTGVSKSEDDNVFNRMVSKVSEGMDKFETKLESQVAKSRTSTEQKQDLVSRVAAKVGQKAEELDTRIASASKSAGDKLD